MPNLKTLVLGIGTALTLGTASLAGTGAEGGDLADRRSGLPGGAGVVLPGLLREVHREAGREHVHESVAVEVRSADHDLAFAVRHFAAHADHGPEADARRRARLERRAPGR